jgi:hypothetical protein
MKYSEYLQSDDWKRKRKRKKARSKKCGLCLTSEAILDVHHLNYRNLYDVQPAELKVLCRSCHDLVHELLKSGALTYQSADWKHRWRVTQRAVRAYHNPTNPIDAKIKAAATRKSGWTKKQLAEWGVPWPPPKGWRQKLIDNPPPSLRQ